MTEKRCEYSEQGGMGARCDQVATGQTEDGVWVCEYHDDAQE